MKNISSTYLHYIRACSSMSSKILSSRSVINIIAYSGANLVPIHIYQYIYIYIYISLWEIFVVKNFPQGKFSSRKVMNLFKKNRHFSKFLSISHLILWGEKVPCRFLKSIFIYFKKNKD